MAHGILLKTTPQEIGPPKQSIIHTSDSCNKTKAHKQILEYKITKDDVDLATKRVHDRTTKEYEEVKNQRGRIRNELDDIK